jgi:hypothetical protein
MVGRSKKPNSLVGTIIAIYFLFMIISRTNLVGLGGLGKSNSLITVIIGIIVVTRILSIVKKTSKSGNADIWTKSNTKRAGSEEKFKDSSEKRKNIDLMSLASFDNDSKNMNASKKSKNNQEVIIIDESNHYAEQYKNLYESGLMTKDEYNDRINKLNK